MPLYLNDEQTMLRDTTKDFVAEHAPVSHMRALRDADDATGFSRDVWKSFAEMGFTGILIGEDQGGLGLGHVEAGVVLEEIGRNLSPSPFLTTAVAAVAALQGIGAGGAVVSRDHRRRHRRGAGDRRGREASRDGWAEGRAVGQRFQADRQEAVRDPWPRRRPADRGRAHRRVGGRCRGRDAVRGREGCRRPYRRSAAARRCQPRRTDRVRRGRGRCRCGDRRGRRRPRSAEPACCARAAPVPRPSCWASAAVRWT